MTERIIEIADTAARLCVRHAQLVIQREGEPDVTAPLEEIAALVLAHPGSRLTQAVIAGVASSGGSVLVCDETRLPVAMLLPLQAHFVQTERLARQVQLPASARKRSWQQIVRAKIRAQSRLLIELHGNDGGVGQMVKRVRSGDPQNVEAQASRIYWPRLFGDPQFRRARHGPGANKHLNYGYAVLRAVTARAVCAAGLHPSLGLQHSNRYDPFCLADDMMEPYRPLVDRIVALWVREHDAEADLDHEAKSCLLGPLLGRYVVNGEARTLFDVLSRAASSLARVVVGESSRMEIPEVSVLAEAEEVPCQAGA